MGNAVDWLGIAKTLQPNQKIRAVCCGRGTTMIVSESPRGYSAYCFRCGRKEFQPHKERSVAQCMRLPYQNNTKAPLELPKGYTTDIPQKYATWFMKCGISPEIALSYGIGWVPEMHRICLPVYDVFTEELVALQLRAVDKNQEPKYLNPEGPATGSALFMSGPPTGITVITEDILSAIKVSRVCHATSILGTKLTEKRLEKLAAYNHTCVVWLDSDKAGRDGARKVAASLKLLGVRVYMVHSELDPKAYNSDQIKEILKGMQEC